ncbi:bleomycin resistance family protein [Chitinophaga caeni]|uniref:Bleomycin resistance family protein n=2 Tax=Chitinophaga caeni TaxID=2029983 RepID=A0A291R192_9BACT|nr:bleomycin resistance family protein [Chitinophaga caeni]
MLYTRELDTTILFYVETLGFTLAERNDDWGWASLYKDEVAMMLAVPNEHTVFEKAMFTGSFYFNTDDVEALWNQLKDKVKICYPIETFEWEMREFAIYDNNGYILQFGQNMESR